MRNIVISACTLLLVLTSCQREVSFEEGTGNNSGGNDGVSQTGSLLTRTVAVDDPDSTATYYTYDAAKRLTFIKAGDYSVFNGDMDLRLIRSSSGNIQKIRYIQGQDSVEYTLSYNTTSKKYTHRISVFDMNGVMIKDSAVFTYDGTGRIVREDNFYTNGATNIQVAKTDYTYSGNGNITKIKFYSIGASNQLEAISELNLEYDTKESPLKMGAEGVVSGFFFYTPVNNITKLAIVDITDPSNNDEIALTYTYNSQNKPSKSIATQQSINSQLETRYYY